jgi:hypothetical protein
MVAGGNILLLAVSTSVMLLICYNVTDHLYQQWFDAHRHQYHSFLQLIPNDYKPQQSGHGDSIVVFCLGGSTTEFADSKARDWASRVEQIIRTKYGMRNVIVNNLGREWYTSLHTLINFEANLRQYKPSVIIVMQSINDLLQNADFSYFSHGPFREDYGHFYGPVNRIINRRSLWQYISDVISRSWYVKPRRVITTHNFPGLKSYVRNMATLIELARHDSTKVILMTEPYLVSPTMTEEEVSAVGMLKVEAINDDSVWSMETMVNGMEQYNGALKAIAEANDIPMVDLESNVPKSLTYFRDEVHYRDTTFEIIAPIIANRLHTVLTQGHNH